MIYFLSDAHLGSRAVPHARQQERRLVRFLDDIKTKASAVYLLGDMFDFWFEYRTAVPKGCTRFLGKLSELTDRGVEVHFFTGNHDIWCWDYLEQECGVIVHHQPVTVELGGSVFYLAHGDGLGDPDWKFKFLRGIFHSKVCQWLFAKIHPGWGLEFGLRWAAQSRRKHGGGEPPYQGPDGELLVCYARDYLRAHPNVNYFVFGHRHIEVDESLSPDTRVLMLGDWITKFTYAAYDGTHVYLENYVEGETQV
ncbi:MAG: UDP-2,3-diacylglucosamine diphosphatase [Bacteroidaceae bacterium]|nr:UDP-2,3-diacylglucosamine diphosphatase [Bacteroidaceae bacterium]